MTSQTQDALDRAVQRLTDAKIQLAHAQDDYLIWLATDVETRALAFLKATATDNAAAARALGSDGAQKLKADVMTFARTFAETLRSARSDVRWPLPDRWVMSQEANSSVSRYAKDKVQDLAAILMSAGFRVTSLNPQTLLPGLQAESPAKREVHNALVAVAEAQTEVDTARKANDTADIDDLFS